MNEVLIEYGDGIPEVFLRIVASEKRKVINIRATKLPKEPSSKHQFFQVQKDYFNLNFRNKRCSEEVDGPVLLIC